MHIFVAPIKDYTNNVSCQKLEMLQRAYNELWMQSADLAKYNQEIVPWAIDNPYAFLLCRISQVHAPMAWWFLEAPILTFCS